MMFFFWFGSVWFWILGRYVWRVRVHRFFFFAPHLEINENEELRYLERLRYSLMMIHPGRLTTVLSCQIVHIGVSLT